MRWVCLLVAAALWGQADAAREAMRTGKYAEAARLYAALVKANPQDANLRLNVALALYSARQYPPAMAELKLYLKAMPGSPQGNMIAGATALKLKDGCGAVAYFEKARSLETLPEYLEQRGEAEAACGQGGAGVWFERLTALQPRNPRGWYGLGLARLASGDEAGAKVAFERLAALGPTPELQRLERDVARGLWKAGRFAEARDALLRVKAAGVKDATVEYELGDAVEHLDGPEAAIVFYREAVRLDTKQVNAQAALGRALLAVQKPAEAIAPLEVAARSGIDKSLWAALANAYRAVGRMDAARLALQKAR